MHPLSRIDPDDPYPESDGEPMAENTLQFDWIVKIKENLEILFADEPNVFVAGDLLWYPLADRTISGPLAPDAMVVFGRPKGPRGCYKQWEEDGLAPQVVFEVLSPSNSVQQMRAKRQFYETYGVEEYYVYDPQRHRLEIWQRQNQRLRVMTHVNGWVSPRLNIRFALRQDTLEIFHPDGTPFYSPVELARLRLNAERRAEQERQRAEQEHQQAKRDRQCAEQERQRAEQEHQRAEQECQRADRAEQQRQRLAAQLRALGVEPEEHADSPAAGAQPLAQRKEVL